VCVCVCVFFFFCSARDQTQDLVCATTELYPKQIVVTPLFVFVLFEIGSHYIVQAGLELAI
jgi:hypothetical protein